ncbi:hypothetical protein Salat_1671900 [Sesamum alatum]|uniref:Reverse transcriptase zinc-binding domain-containing protein n=1 Tax=Sesamum alatum TaxID=300844 RepID=A0AAE1Y803_9LAMI|nr:hypothetical protein Salat_1671900 [Sesamum alatum]
MKSTQPHVPNPPPTGPKYTQPSIETRPPNVTLTTPNPPNNTHNNQILEPTTRPIQLPSQNPTHTHASETPSEIIGRPSESLTPISELSHLIPVPITFAPGQKTTPTKQKPSKKTPTSQTNIAARKRKANGFGDSEPHPQINRTRRRTLDNGAAGNRNTTIQVQCTIRGAEIEPLQHVLLHCPFARQVWALSNLPWGVISREHESVRQWLWDIYAALERKTRDKFLALCWGLWQNGNQMLMEGRSSSQMEVVRSTLRLHEAYVESGRKLRVHAMQGN